MPIALIGLGIAGLIQAIGGVMQASAQQQQMEYEAQRADREAKSARLQAGDVQARANVAAGTATMQGSLVQDRQVTAQAASGVDPSVGSAALNAAYQGQLAQLDALTIHNNATRAAMGLQQHALDLTEYAKQVRSGKDAVMVAAGLNLGAKALGPIASIAGPSLEDLFGSGGGATYLPSHGSDPGAAVDTSGFKGF